MNEYGQNVVSEKQIHAHMKALLQSSTPAAALKKVSITIDSNKSETFSLGDTSATERDALILQDASELLEEDAKAKAREEAYWEMERKLMVPEPVEPVSNILDANGEPVQRSKRAPKKVALIAA
jgi:ketopantoate reductase